jgi:hypothetical protein
MYKIEKSVIVESIRDALKKTGKVAFKESQSVVPVDTGALKKSGSFQTVNEGFIICYAKEYASIIEKGWKGGKVWTSSFRRSNGVKVKGHYKKQPFREGRYFIENSLKKYFVEMSQKTLVRTSFQENILIVLQENFPGKIIIEI